MKALTSIGPANRVARSEETHPLTWRLRDDAQPVWLAEYQAKNGYAAARKALTEMAHGLHIDLVLLGHHRQDQAETVLLQALRGGSLAGLAAMPTRRDREGIAWVRPWLNQPRCRIEVYGRLHGLTHVDDDSNSDPRFARNRLRTQVWPALTAAFPQGEQALADTADRLADAQSVVQAWASSVLPADQGAPWALSDWLAWPAALRRLTMRFLRIMMIHDWNIISTSTPMITAASTSTAMARARPGRSRPSTTDASTWVSWNTSRPDSSVTTSPSFSASHMPNSIISQAAILATGGLGWATRASCMGGASGRGGPW